MSNEDKKQLAEITAHIDGMSPSDRADVYAAHAALKRVMQGYGEHGHVAVALLGVELLCADDAG